MKRIVTVIALCALMALGFYIGYKIPIPKQGITYKAEKVTEYIEIDNLSSKVAELKHDILVQLAGCETQGIKEPDGYVKLDSNDFLSWGRYQYQRPTIQLYVKKFYGQEINLQRAGLIAWGLDKDIPLDELTLKIIFQDEGKGLGNWYVCSKKLNLYAQVDIIKKLTH